MSRRRKLARREVIPNRPRLTTKHLGSKKGYTHKKNDKKDLELAA